MRGGQWKSSKSSATGIPLRVFLLPSTARLKSVATAERELFAVHFFFTRPKRFSYKLLWFHWNLKFKKPQNKNRNFHLSIFLVSSREAPESWRKWDERQSIICITSFAFHKSRKKWFNLRFVDVFISLSLASPSSAKKYHKRIVNYSRVRGEQWEMLEMSNCCGEKIMVHGWRNRAEPLNSNKSLASRVWRFASKGLFKINWIRNETRNDLITATNYNVAVDQHDSIKRGQIQPETLAFDFRKSIPILIVLVSRFGVFRVPHAFLDGYPIFVRAIHTNHGKRVENRARASNRKKDH